MVALDRHEHLCRVALVASFLTLVAVYSFHFFAQDGHSYVSPDGREYLAMVNGELARTPINTRILQPYLALSLSLILGAEPAVGFRILTPIELVASVLTILFLLRRRGATIAWQIATLLAIGSGLAVTYGHMPVLVDPLLILLSCLTLAALDHNRIVLALVCALLAALTKENGVLLGFVWGIYAFRRGYKRAALAGGVLPHYCSSQLFSFSPVFLPPA